MLRIRFLTVALALPIGMSSVAVRGEGNAGVVSKDAMVGVNNALASGEGVVGVVNNQVIALSQLRDMIQPAEREARQTLKGPELLDKLLEIEAAAVNKLIDCSLILQEAKVEGVDAPGAAVDERIQQIIDAKYGGNRASFLQILRAQGSTLERFREDPMNEIIVEEMRRRAVAGAANPGEVERMEHEWLQKLRKKAYIKIY